MKLVLRLAPMAIVFFLVLGCTSTAPPSSGAKKVVVAVYTGEYQAYKSSPGLIQNWILYSDRTLKGSWVTKANSYSLDVVGRYDNLADGGLVFEATGQVSIFGLGLYPVQISGIGWTKGNAMNGNFVLFVDKNGFWGDSGAFSATKTKD